MLATISRGNGEGVWEVEVAVELEVAETDDVWLPPGVPTVTVSVTVLVCGGEGSTLWT
jgi:hypothetical protein